MAVYRILEKMKIYSSSVRCSFISMYQWSIVLIKHMAVIATSSNMPLLFASLECHDPVANAKGQKNAIVAQPDGQPAMWTLSSSVKPLFQPSSFNSDNGRKSLCLSVPPEVMAEAATLDEWAVCYAKHHSERLFGKALL